MLPWSTKKKVLETNTNTFEFASTARNEQESQVMLQLLRPKEGELVQDEFIGPHYEYDGSQILYLSDLHLDHIVFHSKCKSRDEIINLLQKIGQNLDKSYREYSGIFSDGNLVVVINGDITHSPHLFQMFTEMKFQFLQKAIIILGNHELWAYPGLSIEEIATKYSELSPIPVSQNEIILFNDEICDKNYSSQSVRYHPKRLSYDTALSMSVDILSKQMSSARMIMLTGIGFSGCNNEFNADNGIYRDTLTRKQEIIESKKFEALYDHFVAATQTLRDRVLVVATHMPIENWKNSPVYEDGIIYISGHTHRNFFHDDGIQRIYADNQNGYHGRNPMFKCIYTDDIYDPFIPYSDGIYEIEKFDYILFYRAKKMNMQLNRDYHKLYMLKKNGYYCFLARLASGKLSVLNGGRGKSFEAKNVEYYYERMDKIINRLSSPLEQYMNIQKKVSETVKAFGGTGRIHGCIVDIDFYNHIYINPIDLTIKGYYAINIVMKWVYDSIPTMLEEHAPVLYKKYQHILESTSANALVHFTATQSQASQGGTEYLETDIYKASREISKMQKLTNNVLSIWNEGLLDPEDRYIEPPRIKIRKPKLAVRTKVEFPKKTSPKPKENKGNRGNQARNKYLGMTRIMKCGLSATVIEYIDCKNLTVQFEDGVIKQGVRSDHFMEGKVSHSL